MAPGESVEGQNRHPDLMAKHKQGEDRLRRYLKRVADQARASMGMMPRYYTASLASYRISALEPREIEEQKVALRLVGEFVDAFPAGESLLMFGRPGTGKTHLANAIVNELIGMCVEICVKNGAYPPEFVPPRMCITTVADIARRMRDAMKGQGESESVVMDHFSEVKLLVVDEIGVQGETDAEFRYLTEIIDNRYGNMLPSVFAGNVEISEFELLIGERAADRLGGTAHALIMNWPSYRRPLGEPGDSDER